MFARRLPDGKQDLLRGSDGIQILSDTPTGQFPTMIRYKQHRPWATVVRCTGRQTFFKVLFWHFYCRKVSVSWRSLRSANEPRRTMGEDAPIFPGDAGTRAL